eukprot:scaffold7572_cov248-Pinguiococcus_pyrenoidosus.AAC.3
MTWALDMGVGGKLCGVHMKGDPRPTLQSSKFSSSDSSSSASSTWMTALKDRRGTFVGGAVDAR